MLVSYFKPNVFIASIYFVYFIVFKNFTTNIFKYFRADLKVTKDLIYFDNTYKGAANVEYLVTSKEKFTDDGLIKEPEFLNDVGKLEKFLEDKPDVGKGLTVPDFLKQTRQAFSGDDPSYFILPDTKEINTFNLEAEAVKQGEDVAVRQVVSNINTYKNDLKYFDWFLIKSGDQGVMTNKSKQLLSNYLLVNDSFFVYKNWLLPDNTDLLLMRRKELNSELSEINCDFKNPKINR